jgi:glycosyltransferase involved in cell wall biosynthesis
MISVCLASYNGEKYIKEQILSILPQLSLEDELIVSDDGSKDNTCEIVKSISDSRIFLLRGSDLGPPRNFEKMLKLARGDVIFLSDQDDIWLNSKVDLMMEQLQFFDLVISDCMVTNETLEPIFNSYFESIYFPKIGLLNNLYKNSYIGCCMAIRRQLLSHALPFPRMVVMHDWWLGLIANYFGKICIINQPLIMYRRHSSNYSSTGTKSQSSIFLKVNWRIKMVFCLLLAIYRNLAIK